MVNNDYKSLPNVAFVIATLALVAGITTIILGEFQQEQETTTSSVNETFDCGTLGTAVTLDYNSTTTNFVQLVNNTFVNVSNRTGVTDVLQERAGNFTVDVTAGTITCVAGGNLTANTEYNVSYFYTLGSTARSIYGEGVTGILEITSWIDIMALILAVGILLYIVVKVIGRDVSNRFGGRGY